MNKINPKVDGYIRKSAQWQAELQALRAIILDSELTEEIKWRVPCYTLEGRNVLFIGRFKESCVLSFIKGALLEDAKRVLIQQTENSQSVRVIRFSAVEQINEIALILKAYIDEAVQLEKSGTKVQLKKTSEFKIPEEFENRLKKDARLKKAFAALTPGRQRAYLLHFSGAKQAKTRESRIDKWTPHILNGKGLDDE